MSYPPRFAFDLGTGRKPKGNLSFRYWLSFRPILNSYKIQIIFVSSDNQIYKRNIFFILTKNINPYKIFVRIQ